jgi:hypothetical protein
VHLYGGVHLADGHTVTFWSEGEQPYRRGPPGALDLATQARDAHRGDGENWFVVERLGRYLICSKRGCALIPR